MAANRIVYLSIDNSGIGAIYLTTLKSAKQKVFFYDRIADNKESPSLIEWLYSVGAVNNKTQFFCYDVQYTIGKLYEQFTDEMEFVGLTIDMDNCYDVGEYYDILSTRQEVPILESPDVYDIVRGLNLALPKRFDDSIRLSKALLVKEIYDEILKRNVVVGETPIEVEV